MKTNQVGDSTPYTRLYNILQAALLGLKSKFRRSFPLFLKAEENSLSGKKKTPKQRTVNVTRTIHQLEKEGVEAPIRLTATQL